MLWEPRFLVGSCQICGAQEVRLRTITGHDQLADRRWHICVPCHLILRSLADQIYHERWIHQTALAQGGLMPAEKEILALLGLGPADIAWLLPADQVVPSPS